jgi:hypothetical protein
LVALFLAQTNASLRINYKVGIPTSKLESDFARDRMKENFR